MWINVLTNTVSEPIFAQIGGGKDFFCVDLTWNDAYATPNITIVVI